VHTCPGGQCKGCRWAKPSRILALGRAWTAAKRRVREQEKLEATLCEMLDAKRAARADSPASGARFVSPFLFCRGFGAQIGFLKM